MIYKVDSTFKCEEVYTVPFGAAREIRIEIQGSCKIASLKSKPSSEFSCWSHLKVVTSTNFLSCDIQSTHPILKTVKNIGTSIRCSYSVGRCECVAINLQIELCICKVVCLKNGRSSGLVDHTVSAPVLVRCIHKTAGGSRLGRSSDIADDLQ